MRLTIVAYNAIECELMRDWEGCIRSLSPKAAKGDS